MLRAQDDLVGAAVRIVLGVARLGERDLAGWWGTHGLARAGRFVLSRSFPHSWRSAALELDIVSATRQHEDVLGRSTALHLFSDNLPFRQWTLAWLAEQKTATDTDPVFDELVGWEQESARRRLRDWAGPAPHGERLPGVLRLGEVRAAELEDESRLLELVRDLGAAYVEQDVQQLHIPYVDLVRS